jgi:Asp-tRNA(Asn)/Glu-tRNA(Gln) amidotransferase A subunit family amidase
MSAFSFVGTDALVEAYRQGRTDPEAVAKRVLEAVAEMDRLDPPLRAFVAQRSEDVLNMARSAHQRYANKAPRGPLDGVPVAVKDELHQQGYPTTVGTRFLGRRPAERDATVVQRLRKAGAVLLGKTNMHEAGIGVTGINPHHGPARNPYDPQRITGGSSSGSAAAVAAGFCPLALGADGGGSIRIPAALCGVVGIKPSYGRVSEHGAFPLCWSVAHVGPLAGTLSDAVRGLELISGSDPHDSNTWRQPPLDLAAVLKGQVRGMRIGICKAFFDSAENEVAEVCMKVLEQLEAQGARLVEIEIDGLEYVRPVHYITIGVEMAAALYEHTKEHRKEFGADTRILLEVAGEVSAVDYIRAQRLRTRICRGFNTAFERIDVLSSPTTSTTATEIRPAALRAGENDQKVLEDMTDFSFAANLTGLPAVSVPAGYDGCTLPIGIQFMGPMWGEAIMLQAAAAVDRLVKRKKPNRFSDLLA